MKNVHYKNFTIDRPLCDYDSALRYLKGKDQVIIMEDDPDFFAFIIAGNSKKMIHRNRNSPCRRS